MRVCVRVCVCVTAKTVCVRVLREHPTSQIDSVFDKVWYQRAVLAAGSGSIVAVQKAQAYWKERGINVKTLADLDKVTAGHRSTHHPTPTVITTQTADAAFTLACFDTIASLITNTCLTVHTALSCRKLRFKGNI